MDTNLQAMKENSKQRSDSSWKKKLGSVMELELVHSPTKQALKMSTLDQKAYQKQQ